MLEDEINQTANILTKRAKAPRQPAQPLLDPTSIEFQQNLGFNDTNNAYLDLAWQFNESLKDMRNTLDTDFEGRFNQLEQASQGKVFQTAQESAQYQAEAAKLKYNAYQQYKDTAARNTINIKIQDFDKVASSRVEAVTQDPTSVDAIKQELASRARPLVPLTGNPDATAARLRQANMKLDITAIKTLSDVDPYAAQKFYEDRRASYSEDYGEPFINAMDAQLQQATYAATKQYASSANSIIRNAVEGDVPPDALQIAGKLQGTPMAALYGKVEFSIRAHNTTKNMTVPELQQMAANPKVADEMRQFAADRLEAIQSNPQKVLANLGRYTPTQINIYDPTSLNKRLTEVTKASDQLRFQMPLLTKSEQTKLGTRLASMSVSQASETVNGMLAGIQPQDRLRVAGELRGKGVGARSELAYLSAIDPRFSEYAKRYEILSDAEKEKLEDDKLIDSALEDAGIKVKDERAAAMREAIKVYMGGKKVKVDRAIEELYSAVNSGPFGKVIADVPGIGPEFETLLAKASTDPAFLAAHSNGEPMLTNGDKFTMIDDGVFGKSIRTGMKLEPTKKPGQFFVTLNGAYVGTKDQKKFVLNLSREINELAIRNGR